MSLSLKNRILLSDRIAVVMLKVSCGGMAIITIITSVVEADLYGQAKEDGEDVRSFTGRARSTSPIDQQS